MPCQRNIVLPWGILKYWHGYAVGMEISRSPVGGKEFLDIGMTEEAKPRPWAS